MKGDAVLRGPVAGGPRPAALRQLAEDRGRAWGRLARCLVATHALVLMQRTVVFPGSLLLLGGLFSGSS